VSELNAQMKPSLCNHTNENNKRELDNDDNDNDDGSVNHNDNNINNNSRSENDDENEHTMTNLDGLYASCAVDAGTVLFTEKNMPNCELHRSKTNWNCEIVTMEQDNEDILAVVSSRDIATGEFFCAAESDSEDDDSNDDDDDDNNSEVEEYDSTDDCS